MAVPFIAETVGPLPVGNSADDQRNGLESRNTIAGGLKRKARSGRSAQSSADSCHLLFCEKRLADTAPDEWLTVHLRLMDRFMGSLALAYTLPRATEPESTVEFDLYENIGFCSWYTTQREEG